MEACLFRLQLSHSRFQRLDHVSHLDRRLLNSKAKSEEAEQRALAINTG